MSAAAVAAVAVTAVVAGRGNARGRRRATGGEYRGVAVRREGGCLDRPAGAVEDITVLRPVVVAVIVGRRGISRGVRREGIGLHLLIGKGEEVMSSLSNAL